MANENLVDETAVSVGELLVHIATTVRRYKSDHNLPLGTQLQRLQLTSSDQTTAAILAASATDLTSITRAQQIDISSQPHPDAEPLVVTILP